jgi:hypothetical protein
MKQPKDKMNRPKIVIFSLIALGFIYLSFTQHWTFIIGAVILMFLNQREIMGKKTQ